MRILNSKHTMKSFKILKNYIWLINTIYHSKGISLEEINERWIRNEMSDGLPLSRATFNRYKEAIEEIFDLNIDCQRKGGYLYTIENESILNSNKYQNWLLDTLSISNMLIESDSLQNRIVLENIPAGKQYLQPIINAMKQDHKLLMTYHKFGQQESYTITIEPYAIKVFKQRWYLVAMNPKRETPSIYALDRIEHLEETEETFQFPADFDTEAFFRDCYGVLSGTGDKAQHIVIRTFAPYMNYLRTRPLHHSQKEVQSTPEYADFEFYLRPTFDFRQELLAQGHDVEVLCPAPFREEMKATLEKMLSRYQLPQTDI